MATTYLQKLRLFNRDVRLFLITAAIFGFVWDGVRMVLFNLYLLRLGYGTESIGLINAVGPIAFSVFAVLLGALGARWNGRHSIMVGLSLMAAGLALLPLTGALPPEFRTGWLYGMTVVTYLGLAFWWVYTIPFLMGATSTAERSHAFSVQIALAPLAAVAGSLVGGALPGIFARVKGISPDDPAAYAYSLIVAAVLLIPAALALAPAGDPNYRIVPAGVARSTAAGTHSKAPGGLILLVGMLALLRFCLLYTSDAADECPAV